MMTKWFEDQGQWPPFSIPAESIPGCVLGANLVILAHICDELSRVQAEFPIILSHNGQNDLEGQGQWPPFSIPVEGIPWCMLGANLVILAQICDRVITRTSRVSYNSKSKWPKWPWRSRSMTSIFNTSRGYPRMHVWCKFGDSSSNLWRVIVRTR